MTDERFEDLIIRRRNFLRLAGSAAAATALGGLAGCAPATEGPVVVEVPLDSVPMGGRLQILVGEMPVELLRGPDGVEARSLWCTHTGCTVKWLEDRQIYFCACHDGEYDADGKVVSGPPPRPLGRLPVTVTESTILMAEPT